MNLELSVVSGILLLLVCLGLVINLYIKTPQNLSNLHLDSSNNISLDGKITSKNSLCVNNNCLSQNDINNVLHLNLDSSNNISLDGKITSKNSLCVNNNCLSQNDINNVVNLNARKEVFMPDTGYNLTYQQGIDKCASYGASVATTDQLTKAQAGFGADWCSTGWVSDSLIAQFPITTTLGTGCGNGSAGTKQYRNATSVNDTSNFASVNCYGVKPASGMLKFNKDKYSMYS